MVSVPGPVTSSKVVGGSTTGGMIIMSPLPPLPPPQAVNAATAVHMAACRANLPKECVNVKIVR